MYRHYWQLAETPFAESLDPRYYYPAEPHQGALLQLRYALEQNRGAAALTGPSGSGKTLLLLMLRRLLDERFRPFCHLTFPKLPGDDFLAYVAEELSGVRFKHTPGPRESLRMIEDALVAAVREGRRPVLVIDESHLLEDRHTWERLRMLLGLLPGEANPLSLLFVGHTTLLGDVAPTYRAG
ncbi:MAG: AAA family ATPase [Pirellulales bacterium]